MPVPTHREDCKTRTWRAYCPDCHKPVWFFSCTCGSKVFFDRKGYPWPEHRYSCPIYNIRLMMLDGSPVTQIRALLESEARARGSSVPDDTRRFLDKNDTSGKLYVQDILPSDQPCEIEGVVRVINQINVYKRFDIEKNPITTKILGKLALQPFLEITVRERQIGSKRRLSEWTFLIPANEVECKGFHIGTVVRASLLAYEVMDEDAVWLAEYIDWD
jgi:hypothetical protein